MYNEYSSLSVRMKSKITSSVLSSTEVRIFRLLKMSPGLHALVIIMLFIIILNNSQSHPSVKVIIARYQENIRHLKWLESYPDNFILRILI